MSDPRPSPVTWRAEDLVWVDLGPSTDAEQALRRRRRVRVLDELRRPLPLEPALLEACRGWTFRHYRPGVDDEALLRVNNAAFSWHPDQGGWTTDQLAEQAAGPSFRPEDVIVHDAEGRPGWIDGFCWTRLDPATTDHPELGEIFVIGTDPDASGRGLGRALAVAGLDHQHRRGARVATLFVEHHNDAAQQLYASLGFTRHRQRAGYTSSP